MTTLSTTRIEAWRSLDTDSDALDTLAQDPSDDLLLIERGCDRSNLAQLLGLAESVGTAQDPESIESPKCNTSVRFDVVSKALEVLSHSTKDHVTTGASVARIVHLTFRWNLQIEAERKGLVIDKRYAREVIKSLIDCVGDARLGGLRTGKYELAKEMARPYLDSLDPTDPISRFFSRSHERFKSEDTEAADEPELPSHLVPLRRALDHALAQLRTPSLSSSVPPQDRSNDDDTTHSLTPEELLHILAPKYLSQLRRAPEPPLGISSTYDPNHATGGQLASAFAGKVYSEQEFRNRGEGLPSGLSAAGPGSIYSTGPTAQLGQAHQSFMTGGTRGRGRPGWGNTAGPPMPYGSMEYGDPHMAAYGLTVPGGGQRYNAPRGLGIHGVEEHSYGTEVVDPRLQVGYGQGREWAGPAGMQGGSSWSGAL